MAQHNTAARSTTIPLWEFVCPIFCSLIHSVFHNIKGEFVWRPPGPKQKLFQWNAFCQINMRWMNTRIYEHLASEREMEREWCSIFAEHILRNKLCSQPYKCYQHYCRWCAQNTFDLAVFVSNATHYVNNIACVELDGVCAMLLLLFGLWKRSGAGGEKRGSNIHLS